MKRAGTGTDISKGGITLTNFKKERQDKRKKEGKGGKAKYKNRKAVQWREQCHSGKKEGKEMRRKNTRRGNAN